MEAWVPDNTQLGAAAAPNPGLLVEQAGRGLLTSKDLCSGHRPYRTLPSVVSKSRDCLSKIVATTLRDGEFYAFPLEIIDQGD